MIGSNIFRKNPIIGPRDAKHIIVPTPTIPPNIKPKIKKIASINILTIP